MNIALLVGCARSGTSILGELIGAHSDIKYIFEAHQVWELGGLGANDSHRLTAEHATPPVKKKVREWFQGQLQGAKIVLEKTPRNILRTPYIHEIFPEAKIIHLIRDGRDVACSMVPGCGRQEWRHLKPPSWREFYANYAGAKRCARAWMEIMEIGLEDLRNIPHLQLRYEDLVTNPRSIAEEILGYIGLKSDPMVTKYCSRVANDTVSSYHAAIQDRWFENNHRFRIGRWRENLVPAEQETITSLLSPMLARLGYSIG